jgi:hypothetical protein
VAILAGHNKLSVAHSRSHFLPLFLAVIFWALAALASAETATPSEQQIKAIFIYKFCLYVEWPTGTFDSASSPLTIGVVDADEIATELESKSNELMIDGRPLVVRRLDSGAKLDDLNLLFIADTQDDKLTHWIDRARGHPLLVVTETAAGLNAGSSINFFLQDNRVRFDVALDTAQRHGLKLGAQLLQVARTIRRGETQ